MVSSTCVRDANINGRGEGGEKMKKDFQEFRKLIIANYDLSDHVNENMLFLLNSIDEEDSIDSADVAKIVANATVLTSIDLIELYHNWLNQED